MSRYIGWAVEDAERARLLERFTPAYPEVIADHVTLKFAPGRPGPLPTERSGEIVGVADDGRGVQALVVAIGGATQRPDGSRYHITWSLGPGREARESNDVIRERGWSPLARPVPVALSPQAYPASSRASAKLVSKARP